MISEVEQERRKGTFIPIFFLLYIYTMVLSAWIVILRHNLGSIPNISFNSGAFFKTLFKGTNFAV